MRLLNENRSRGEYKSGEQTLASEFVRSSADISRLSKLRTVNGVLYNLVYSSDCHCPHLGSIECDPNRFGLYDQRERTDKTMVYMIRDDKVSLLDEPMFVVLFGNEDKPDRSGFLTRIDRRCDK